MPVDYLGIFGWLGVVCFLLLACYVAGWRPWAAIGVGVLVGVPFGFVPGCLAVLAALWWFRRIDRRAPADDRVNVRTWTS